MSLYGIVSMHMWYHISDNLTERLFSYAAGEEHSTCHFPPLVFVR
jgi:hypothetical protein